MSEISNNSSISNSQLQTVQKKPEIGNKLLNPANNSLKLPESKINSNGKRAASTVEQSEQTKPATKALFGGRSFGASSQKINPDLMQDHARKS